MGTAVEGPFVLVGHSYGGWIALLLASRHPDLVAGLVLVDTPHPREWVAPDDAQRTKLVRGARKARLAAFGARFGFTRAVAFAVRFGFMRAFFQLGRFRSSSEHDRITSLLCKNLAAVAFGIALTTVACEPAREFSARLQPNVEDLLEDGSPYTPETQSFLRRHHWMESIVAASLKVEKGRARGRVSGRQCIAPNEVAQRKLGANGSALVLSTGKSSG